MPSLEAVFEQRRDSQANVDMLANLAIVVAAHEERPGARSEGFMRLHYLQKMSAYPSDQRTVIDRSPALLAAHHDVTVEQLQDFADNGTVADVGPGESTFLDVFRHRAQTMAVDQHEDHVAFQSRKGHYGVWSPAHDMLVDSEDIRLLHASYSAPFWSASVAEAVDAADEYVRVLELGGIALVGPFGRKDEHEHYEYAAMAKRNDGRPTLPWEDPEDAPLSRIRMAFCSRLLDRASAGEVELVGSRYIEGDMEDFRRGARHLHVPNFMMMRRVG